MIDRNPLWWPARQEERPLESRCIIFCVSSGIYKKPYHSRYIIFKKQIMKTTKFCCPKEKSRWKSNRKHTHFQGIIYLLRNVTKDLHVRFSAHLPGYDGMHRGTAVAHHEYKFGVRKKLEDVRAHLQGEWILVAQPRRGLGMPRYYLQAECRYRVVYHLWNKQIDFPGIARCKLRSLLNAPDDFTGRIGGGEGKGENYKRCL